MAVDQALLLSFYQFQSGNSCRNGWKDGLPEKVQRCELWQFEGENGGMWASHRGEAGTRQWKQQRRLKRQNPRCSTKSWNKREVRMCAGSRVSCLQREAKGHRGLRGQGEGLALPPGCSTTFKNRGMRDTNQRLNQINKDLFPLRACGLPCEAAAVTNAAQHEELSSPSCALRASQARQPLRLLLKDLHLP